MQKKTWKILLNITLLLVIGGFLWYVMHSLNKEDVTYVETKTEEQFTNSYARTLSFELPEEINRFELNDGKLYVSAGQSVYVYDKTGKQLISFNVKQDVRDITVNGKEIYVLYPTFLEVYADDGTLTRDWEACSELSDYCSLAVAGNFVFVTDAENKNICKYTSDGNFVAFINSPSDFIIPSHTFDIVSRNDTIYCSNSGRHLVESYTLDGDFITAFGSPGGGAGNFAGCCNPSYISFTPDGDFLTSEKGNPRISKFGKNGEFMNVILNNRILGGGNKAYEAYMDEEQLFVAGGNKISIFQFDDTPMTAKATPCSTCTKNCPLSKK